MSVHISLLGVVAVLCLLDGIRPTAAESTGWRHIKEVADDLVYADHRLTFYCGCPYSSDPTDRVGSGALSSEQLKACEYVPRGSYWGSAAHIEWEHVVPVSLMPAAEFDCWVRPGGGREVCEEQDATAQAMIFDLHNLVPSIGQMNRLRSNDRYGEVVDGVYDAGCAIVRNQQGSVSNGVGAVEKPLFEPADCTKGDVARIWFYMRDQHGVSVSDAELEMFWKWSAEDPVSPWEAERERRVAKITRRRNPYVAGQPISYGGSCPWEDGLEIAAPQPAARAKRRAAEIEVLFLEAG